MILPILQIGDEILKKKSAPVTEYNDELKKLLDDMKQTLAKKEDISFYEQIQKILNKKKSSICVSPGMHVLVPYVASSYPAHVTNW